jgi:hypothetical protein
MQAELLELIFSSGRGEGSRLLLAGSAGSWGFAVLGRHGGSSSDRSTRAGEG